MPPTALRALTFVLCGSLAAFGCSDGSGAGNDNPTGAGGSAAGASSGGSSATGGSFSLPGNGAGGSAGGSAGSGSGTPSASGGSGATAFPCLPGDDRPCAGQVYMGQGLPLDIHV